jgi:hypothetical protein
MVLTDLNQLAQDILQQAREKGSVRAADVRAQLVQAGHPENRWKDVIGLIRGQLRYSKGHYQYVSSMTARVREDKRNKRVLTKAIRTLIRNYRKVVDTERRKQRRIHFIQPLKILDAQGQPHDFVCQDMSLTGMRFLGQADLRGQEVKVLVPTFDTGGGQWTFSLRVLWSSPVGNLFMQGGVFLEVVA